MKTLALLLYLAGTLFGYQQEGNFVLRFEPQADLQANAEIPFAIRVHDDLRKPVLDAKVTLQIETPQHTHIKIYNAPAVESGVYVAKPVFPISGEWTVYVEVHRGTQMSARSIDFNVPTSASSSPSP